MSQPPLSQRIRRLEREYGTPLFDRTGGQVRLTPAGQALVEAAREIVARVDAASLLVRRAAAGRAGVLRVGIPPDTAGGLLAALATTFAAAEPDVRLDLHAATTAEQLELLDRGAVEIGVLHHPVETGGLALGPVARVAQGVVLSRRSPLARRTEVALAELAGHGLVLFPRQAAPGLYDETLVTCQRHGFRPRHVRPVANAEFMLGLVAGGRDVAFDQGALAQREPRVVWRPLVDSPVVWEMSAAWKSGSETPVVVRFAELVARLLAESGGPTSVPAAPGTPMPWNVLFRPELSEPQPVQSG
jgi:DNA-binding transcriptional LysR family regulator